MSVAAGGRGRTGTGTRDRLAAAECQCRIDGQRPVTEWGGTSAVSGRAQVGTPSRMGISILVVLVSLLVASGDTTSFASSPAVPPAAGLVDDRCPGCGVGHLQTIWQADRPGRRERQRIAILDSS